MLCKNCGTVMRVKDVRYYDDDKYRLYLCGACGNVEYTVEYEVEQNEGFFTCWKQAMPKRRKNMKGSVSCN